MLNTTRNFRAKVERHFLFVAVLIIFAALLLRNSGAYPVVFSDEYHYSEFSRLLPLADSAVPCYLYLAIYRATNLSGGGYLESARILNALFFVAAAPLIYLTAKRVCTRRVAAIVAVLALLGPINSYTAYYMPESLYFLSFWLVSWFILRLDNASESRSWCVAGILLGFTALVKPHALFLVPALAAYALLSGRRTEGRWVLRALRNAALLAVFALLTKLLIGYALAGKAGVTLFGPYYGSAASNTTSMFERCRALLPLAAENLTGHALAMCLMFAVPLVFAINAACRSLFSKAETDAEQKIALYALAVLVSLVLVTGLFTASVVNSGPYESASRLHMRYYNFAFPLLLVIAAASLSARSVGGTLRWRVVAALPIGLAILYAASTRLAPCTPGFCDCPELRGVTYRGAVFYGMCGMSLLSLVAGMCSARAGAKIFVFLLVPLATVFSNVKVTQEFRRVKEPDVYDRAGLFAKQYLSPEELAKLVVVGSQEAGMYRSLFYVDNAKASLETIPEGSGYDLAKLPAGKEWALVIGDHALPETAFFQLPMSGFTLARANGTNTIDFKAFSWPGIIAKADGLANPEGFGRWSDGDAVTLEWCRPLPERFTVHLVAHAFGPNVGREFVARVGDDARRFTVGPADEEKVLEFQNPKGLRTMRIDVPSAVSPQALGMSDDPRRLGIGLAELRVVQREGK
jgi:phosphoglycerol transferase